MSGPHPAGDLEESRGELFELSLIGGAVERRYRKLRPEVEQLPWGSLQLDTYAPDILAAARATWTEAAFQEHTTAAACTATLKALIAARAPLDLIAMASRFPLDELVHVELAARLAQELGGAAPLLYDPRRLVLEPERHLSPLLQAAELVVCTFCVGEAVSVPLLHGSWRAAEHPLIRAVLGRIVKDEAAHGAFGWMFLEWCEGALTAADREHLGHVASGAVRALVGRWDGIRREPPGSRGGRLGWMDPASYLQLAARTLQAHVVQPLRRFGIEAAPLGELSPT